MSTIKSGTTLTTAYQVEGDTTGSLVFQTGSTPTTAMSISSAQVVTFVNPPVGVDAFASGTAMLFVQTSAPTGWTKSTTHNNKALRIVSGTASSGGTVAFTTAFASQTPTINTSGLSAGATTLDTTQIPSHTHSYTTRTTTYNLAGGEVGPIWGGTGSGSTGSAGGGGSHSHSLSGSATSSAIDLAVQYVDVIIATKN